MIMSLLSRFKQHRSHRPRPPVREQPHRESYTLSLPNPFGGAPLCRATVAVTTTRHTRGETLRLRAHVDGNFHAPSLREGPALADRRDDKARGLIAAGRTAAGALARRGLASLPVSERRLRTWIDVQASTAPLAAGAEALVPERLRELCGGGLPRSPQGEPRVSLFAGPAGVASHAQLALLHLDQDALPSAYRTRPFNLLASVASLDEPACDDYPDN